MRYLETNLVGVYLLEPEFHSDERGFFGRLFCRQELSQKGFDFATQQVNLSGNYQKGTWRGFHFQKEPHAEDKLVRAVSGAILDVALDLRPASPTYGFYTACELSAENKCALLIPKGCAHGYLTLTEVTEIIYLTSAPYRPEAEAGLRWNDPFVGLDLPFEPSIISAKDNSWPDYQKIDYETMAIQP